MNRKVKVKIKTALKQTRGATLKRVKTEALSDREKVSQCLGESEEQHIRNALRGVEKAYKNKKS